MYNVGLADFKLGIIYFLILWFILIICKNITNAPREGFNAGDITGIAGTVNSIASRASSIPGQITAIGSQITSAATGITNAVNTKIGEVETRVNTGVQNTVNAAVNPIKSTIGTVNSDIGKIKSTVDNIPNVVTGLVNTAVNPIKSTVGTVNSDIGTIKSTVDNIPNVVTGLVNTAVNPIKSTVAKIPSEIQTAISQVETKIMGKVNGLISPINTLVNTATAKIEYILKYIEGLPAYIEGVIQSKVQWLIGKIEKFGENIGDLINGGIVTPFLTLFTAMGNVFVQSGDIIMQLINKIKTLPSCSALYMFQSVFGIVDAIYKYIIPGFLVSFISTIYAYTLKIPLEYISTLVGLTAWWDTCFNFNVDDEVNSIRDQFNKVGPAFINSFGHMDFKQLIDFSN